ALRIAAEIGDPAIVGAAIGLTQLDVGEFALPQDSERGIEHRRIETFGVQELEPLGGVTGPERHCGREGLVGVGRESSQLLLPHAAERGWIAAARALAGLAADLEILQAILVALHAERAVL